MYVVLEEIEEDTARLVPDSSNKPLYVPVNQLPPLYEVGDVFLVEEKQESRIYLKRDNKEKDRRLRANRSKRKKLLSKTHTKKPDEK